MSRFFYPGYILRDPRDGGIVELGPEALLGLAAAKPEEEEIVNQQRVFGHGPPLRRTKSARARASRGPA